LKCSIRIVQKMGILEQGEGLIMIEVKVMLMILTLSSTQGK